MLSRQRILDLVLLLMLTLSVADSTSLCPHERKMTQNNSLPLAAANTTKTVLVGEQAVLCCPLQHWEEVLITTWEIIQTNKVPCRIAYMRSTNEIVNNNCTDEQITWIFKPDQRPDLQIDVVALIHEGYYKCEIAEPNGNYYHGYNLQVLGAQTGKSYAKYIISSIILLIIMGFICFLKSSSFRKCKSEKPDSIPVVEEDEMQPYASYTEKSNTLYDTANIARIPQFSASELSV
ncbi:cell surface glycoprotein CD200 receptor 1 isoform X2 [Dipodomys merriami]|uniref:cell surface glycoprotein CD200 receptor 1 isoform X2 n=1 Tax=Dipodomys merriami TaxID=94247 RepID=UPI0038559F00